MGDFVQGAIEYLGYKVRDRITGIVGVATSVSFDLQGCVQLLVNPGIGADGKFLETYWYDISRLEILDRKRVMDLPDFDRIIGPQDVHGPTDKPSKF